MTKTADQYTQKAVELFEAGFTSKAGQKRAFEALASAAELLSKGVRAICFDLRGPAQGGVFPERAEAAYWMNFDLHVWTEKRRAELLGYLPEAEAIANEFDDLAALRKAIKAAPVVKAERKADVRESGVMKSIREMMELRKSQYERGLRLHDLFGGLSVTGNVHYVTNQHGTTFLRTYYYMEGVLTPLKVIFAVLDTKAREAEGK